MLVFSSSHLRPRAPCWRHYFKFQSGNAGTPLNRAVERAADPSSRLAMPGTAVHVMGDDSEAAWGECFICTQEAPISSLVHGVCACRERYMHVACQRQMLEQSAFSESCQVPTCPVCHSEYTNPRMEFKQAPLMSPDQLLQTRLRAHPPSPSHRCPVPFCPTRA